MGRSATAVRFAALALAALLIAGCRSFESPAFEITGVEMSERTGDTALIRFTVRGENPNREQLPLETVRYTVSIQGHPPFTARRSAQATLPGFRTQSFTVPVAISREDGPIPEGRVDYSIRGTVAYRLPGSIADLLFDNAIRRPRAPFGESGTLDFAGAREAREIDPVGSDG